MRFAGALPTSLCPKYEKYVEIFFGYYFIKNLYNLRELQPVYSELAL